MLSAAFFVSSRDSPFNAAWETLIWPSKNTPSTGTLSPDCTRITSPLYDLAGKNAHQFTVTHNLGIGFCCILPVKLPHLGTVSYSDKVNPVASPIARIMLMISTASFSPARAGTKMPSTIMQSLIQSAAEYLDPDIIKCTDEHGPQ